MSMPMTSCVSVDSAWLMQARKASAVIVALLTRSGMVMETDSYTE